MSTYPVASIPLAPIAGLHGGTGTVATTSWVVDPGSVPGTGTLAFLGRDVQVTTFLFQIADAVVPNWFGVAVPEGLTEFGNVHVFFHPTPAQAGYVDADYRSKSGKWPELFYYMERLGHQLSGAERDQVLVMPFLTEAAKDTGILPGSWTEILPDIATAVRDAVAGPSATPVSVDHLVVSSFSAGIVYSDSFRRRAAGLGPVLAEVWDLDGNISSYHAISVALRATAGCPVTRYDQVPGGDAETFHVPQPRWSDVVQPPQNSSEVHALIRDFMFLHGASVSTVGDTIATPGTGTATHTATTTHTATVSHSGTHTDTGLGTASHTTAQPGPGAEGDTGTRSGTGSDTGSDTGTASGTASDPVEGGTPRPSAPAAPAPAAPAPAVPAAPAPGSPSGPAALPAAPGPAPTPGGVPGLTPGPAGGSPAAPLQGTSRGGCHGDASTAAVAAIVAVQATVATTATTAITSIAAQTADRRRRRGAGGRPQ